jgi:hypothetical protein
VDTHTRTHTVDTHNGLALCRVRRKSCSGNAEAGPASDAVCMNEGGVREGVEKGKKGGSTFGLFVSISVHVCVCLSVYWLLLLLTPPRRPPRPGHSHAAKLSEGSRGASATERGSNMWKWSHTHARILGFGAKR